MTGIAAWLLGLALFALIISAQMLAELVAPTPMP